MPTRNEQINQIVKAFEDAAQSSGPMEAGMPLRYVSELQKQMLPEDFYAALCQVALNLISKNLVNSLNWVFEIDPKVAQDPQVIAAAKQYLKTAEAGGLEIDSLKQIFKF